MLARLELNNSLAPIQQYGRHQKRAIDNRKKPPVKKTNAKQGAEGDQPMTESAATAGGAGGDNKKDQYDDKFYDLDDGWICDDDVSDNDDEVGEFITENDPHSLLNSSIVRDSVNGSGGKLAGTIDDEQRVRRLEKKERERIERRFRVVTPAEFESNLSMNNEASGQIDKKQVARPEDSWMPNHAQPANADKMEAAKSDLQMADVNNMTSASGATDVASSTEVNKSGTANKKRTHDEAFPLNQQPCEPSIDEILTSIKQRVLIGESLNNFKKEINQLVELIDRKDSQFDKLADQVGSKLAGLLQKPPQEMIFMLKRHNANGKKNKQK